MAYNFCAVAFLSDWELVLNKMTWKWSLEEKTRKATATTIMQLVSQTLAKQYITKAIEEPKIWLKLEVINVTEPRDLQELLKYLKHIKLVQQVRVLEVSSDVVELSILFRGSFAGFQRNISLGQRLSLKYQDPRNNTLGYVWTH